MNFNQIPTAIRVPFTYVEFSNSEASLGNLAQPYKLLLVGQKLAAGTQPQLTPVKVSSKKQAATLFGVGSMLYKMIEAAIGANQFTEMWAISVADDAAGVAATGTIALTGPATADGSLTLYFGGDRVSVPVTSGDTATDIAADLSAAIQANPSLAVSATVASGTVTWAFKHKGLVGNSYPVVLGYNGEENPAGVGVTITAGTNGTLNPSLSDVISAIGDAQFRTMVIPYTDAGNLALIETEMAKRWGPLYTNDGHVFTATNLDSSPASTLGLSRNSPHLTILGNSGSPTPSYVAAAVLGAVVAFYSPIDQARPLQTLALPGVLPPKIEDQLLLSERNVLLYSGIATTQVDSGGVVRIERVITTHKEDAIGNPDESYLDYETLATLSYLRYSFRAYFGTKYPRHKLAADGGIRYAPGQPVMTPKIAKAEAISLFSDWEEAGLVEDAAGFQEALVVEKDSGNPNRLNFYLPPNLINGLRIIAAQIAFRA